jgi:hypothetical protein
MAGRTYEPVGKCIYCGIDRYAPDSTRALGLEHIIPEGLNGELLLPNASCRDCERRINEAEQHLLKGTLLGCRTYLGLRTKRPKDRPEKLPLYDTSVEPPRRVMIPAEDFPACMLLVRLGVPLSLTNGKTQEPHMRPWACFFRDTQPILAEKYGIKSYSPPAINTRNLARMLAKIAHAYAVAELGLGGFEPLLPEFILGKRDVNDIFLFVGGDHELEPPAADLHEISIVPRPIIEGGYLAQVRVRLFARFGAPTYYVVVGRLSKDWQPI